MITKIFFGDIKTAWGWGNAVRSGGRRRQSVLLIYLPWQFIFLTSILQLIKLWKFGHQNNEDS